MPRDYELRVTLWQIPTGVSEERFNFLLSNALSEMTHEKRCDYLEEAVRDANAHFGVAPPNVTVINVFVVPEYYFADTQYLHFVDELTKDRTLSRLKTISRIGDTVLVPGTLAWIKPFVRAGVVVERIPHKSIQASQGQTSSDERAVHRFARVEKCDAAEER